MSRDLSPFGLRMPPELKARLQADAQKNRRSLNAEIVSQLSVQHETTTLYAIEQRLKQLDDVERKLSELFYWLFGEPKE